MTTTRAAAGDRALRVALRALAEILAQGDTREARRIAFSAGKRIDALVRLAGREDAALRATADAADALEEGSCTTPPTSL